MALILIESPLDTKSGYGYRSKDFAKSLIKIYPSHNYVIIPTRWGNTPTGALDGSKDKDIIQYLSNTPPKQRPDIHIQITIANECRPLGKYNILITAGIETNMVTPEWIMGANKMDLVLVSSKHSKDTFLNTKYNIGDTSNVLSLTTDIDVLFEGYDDTVFNSNNPIPQTIIDAFNKVDTTFNFLFAGVWLGGDIGEDRKDIGSLIITFLNTFKRPKGDTLYSDVGLILKTQMTNTSIGDQYKVMERIDKIKQLISDENEDNYDYPKIILIHSNLSEDELNGLYNHPSIKSYISFTHGEGYNRPTLEFSSTKKPIMIPKFGGHVDYLNQKSTIWLHGKLEKIPAKSGWNGVISKDSSWFVVDYNMASKKMLNMYNNYNSHSNKSIRMTDVSKFTMSAMETKIEQLFSKYVPSQLTAKEIKLNL